VRGNVARFGLGGGANAAERRRRCVLTLLDGAELRASCAIASTSCRLPGSCGNERVAKVWAAAELAGTPPEAALAHLRRHSAG
jgi:hypothetical protein